MYSNNIYKQPVCWDEEVIFVTQVQYNKQRTQIHKIFKYIIIFFLISFVTLVSLSQNMKLQTHKIAGTSTLATEIAVLWSEVHGSIILKISELPRGNAENYMRWR
jgi:hypothetical protein